MDGDHILNEAEQANMIRDLADQNEQLRSAMEALEEAKGEEEGEEEEEDKEAKLEEEKKRRRAEGVMYEDYTYLQGRIDTMENSINSIIGKIDSVLKKVERENPMGSTVCIWSYCYYYYYFNKPNRGVLPGGVRKKNCVTNPVGGGGKKEK